MSKEKEEEKEVDEKKLSAYSLKLCEAIKDSLPYMNNIRAQKKLMLVLNDYMIAYKKLGGK